MPTTNLHQILAFGAQGGKSGIVQLGIGPAVFGVGGRGPEIGGDFTLTAGEILQIAVGGAGMPGTQLPAVTGGGGGGGGSFVIGPGNTPLIIAGGSRGGGVWAGGVGVGGGGRIESNGAQAATSAARAATAAVAAVLEAAVAAS